VHVPRGERLCGVQVEVLAVVADAVVERSLEVEDLCAPLRGAESECGTFVVDAFFKRLFLKVFFLKLALPNTHDRGNTTVLGSARNPSGDFSWRKMCFFPPSVFRV
jgi:hypothetical protein